MSHEILKSELDIFQNAPYQASIESSQVIAYRPIASIADSSSIEFNIPVSLDEYLDLQNVTLWIKGKVVTQDGKDYDSTQNKRISLINYSLNTIWEQLDIYLGNTLISQSANTYPYRSYIEIMTSYPNDSKLTFLQSAGFFEQGKLSSYNFDGHDEIGSKIVQESREFTLYGRIHGDIFKSEKLLLNGVSLRLIFNKGKDKFFLMGSATSSSPSLEATTPLLKLLDATLFVRKVKVSPSIIAAHSKALQISKAKYPIKRTEVKTFNLNSGQSSFILDNMWMGQMPNKLIIGFIDHDAFNGSYSMNPLVFKHNNLNFLAVYMNGEMFPNTPYQPDYKNKRFEREYFEMTNNLNQTLNGVPCFSIIPDNYIKAFCLYSFNFNPDFSVMNEGDYINIPKDGFIRAEIRFTENLSKALKAVCYAQFDNTIEIDSNRNVTTDF